MARILITGGTGFVASHLLEALHSAGERDIHLTAYRDEDTFARQFVSADQIHKVDLTNYDATTALIRDTKPEQIYHLASIASVGDSFERRKFILDSNNTLQFNLLEAVAAHAPQARILHVSSALVYAHSPKAINEQATLGPDNPYALSKLFQDMMAYTFTRSNKLDIVRVRPFNHIGERQTLGFVVADLAANIVKVERGLADHLPVGNLETQRDFSDVKDIVDAYILLMQKGVTGEVYNLGSGRAYQIKEILTMLLSLAKTKVEVRQDQSKIRPVDLNLLVCDNKKISQLGWHPTYQLEDTLGRILNYWRETL